MEWKKLFPKENIFYETENGILYCADNSELLPKFPSGTVDLILTDPPYNIADNNKLTKRKNEIRTTKESWGSEFKDAWPSIEEYCEWLLGKAKEFKRILKDTGSLITFLDRNYSGYFIYRIEKEVGLIPKNKIYFIKRNPVPHFRKNNYRSAVEEAVWFTKGEKYYLNFLSQKEMVQVFTGNIGTKETSHPTEKYIWMVKPLIIRHSKPGDLILDPFAGSGTILAVAEKLKRRWIGIEVNEKYCSLIKNRIEKIRKQKFLF
jgi:DNA modification methylase